MANWGVPDFLPSESVDREAELMRTSLAKAGKVVAFQHNELVERGYSQPLVQIHCVRNSAWQDVRLSMKGKNTVEKLEIIHAYWDKWYGKLGITPSGYDICAIQIGNYLGALRRGGQLDDSNRLRKYR